MVSKASELLPEPETPVITTILFLGITTSMFFKLWVLAPLTTISPIFLSFFIRFTHITQSHPAMLIGGVYLLTISNNIAKTPTIVIFCYNPNVIIIYAITQRITV